MCLVRSLALTLTAVGVWCTHAQRGDFVTWSGSTRTDVHRLLFISPLSPSVTWFNSPGTLWHLPPNSARFSYAAEGVLFIFAQLSSDAVSALRTEVGVLIRCRTNLAPKHPRKHETQPPRGKGRFRLDSNDFGFICSDVSDAVSYKRNVCYNLSCLLQIYCCLSITEKLLVS